MKGIEIVKKALGFAIGLSQSINSSLEDNKMTFFEAIGLIGKVFNVAEIVNNRAQLISELYDLDENEKKELMDWVRDNYDVEDDKIETTLEKTLELVMDIIDYALELSNVWKK